MILGWSLGHDWYDWHDGVGTAKFFWRWNNTDIIWYRYICIYLLVGFELMVESRFTWPTFWQRSPASPRRSNVNQQSVHWFQRITPRNSGFGVLVYQRLRKCVSLGDFLLGWRYELDRTGRVTNVGMFSSSCCSQWLFRIIINLLDHHGPSSWKPGGVHPASQIIYLRKNVCCWAVYLYQTEMVLWQFGNTPMMKRQHGIKMNVRILCCEYGDLGLEMFWVFIL